MAAKRLLIFGGMFDPPHRAHIELPAYAAQQIGADRTVFVPTGNPPQKDKSPCAPAEHRLAMLRLALEEKKAPGTFFLIDTFELDCDAPSYTLNTLKHLRNQHGESVELRLLIGLDQARVFDRWHRPERIVELAEPLVLLRPPEDASRWLAELPPPQQQTWQSRLVTAPQMDISSTHLRRLLRAEPDHPDLSQMLHPAVIAYIREHGLYR